MQAEYAQLKVLFSHGSDADRIALITDSINSDKIINSILSRMTSKLSDIRKQHFKKPVATLPFGISVDAAQHLAQLHPELREIMYEPDQALSDGVFLGCHHLAMRRCLLQLLSIDSGLSENPYAQFIYTAGVDIRHHTFVWRTQVPTYDIEQFRSHEAERFYVVLDACHTTMPVTEVLNHIVHKEAAEALVVSPYDSTMWTHKGGRISSADYVYEWLAPGSQAIMDLVKPTLLPSSFFSTDRYKSWSLYIQPAGVTHGYRFTRDEFMLLHGGVGIDAFFETRIVRCGFAESSYIATYNQPTQVMSVDEAIQRATGSKSIPAGMVRVPRIPADGLRDQLKLGRQYDLYSDAPCVVRASYYDAAYRQFMSIKVERHIISAMMKCLHANSARLVYNGAIVVVEAMVDVESMCVVLEYIASSFIKAKIKLSAVTNLARLPINPSSLDYAQSVAGWAAHSVMSYAQVNTGARKVKDYLAKLQDDRLSVAPLSEEVEADEGLQFGDTITNPQDKEKEELLDVIDNYAKDVFGNDHVLPYNLERTDVEYDKRDMFQLRKQLMMYEKIPITVEQVQMIYDSVFPGNSMIMPTQNQMANEKTDFTFTIDVQYFKMVVPALFARPEELIVVPSRLRTSVGADLATSSFRSMIGSLMKRNFNRPRPEAPGDRELFVKLAIDQAICNHGHKRSKALRDHYHINPIVVSRNVVELWSQTHTIADVIAAATLIDSGITDPSAYRLMPKDVPKPAMSLTAQGQVSVGQTVVYHTKDIIALTAGVFTLILSRLLTYFNHNIRFAFGRDEHTSGEWADTYLNIPGTHVIEIDIPKFDKTQDWTCFELILQVMEVVGTDPKLITFWRRASEKATIFNSLFHLTFTTMFGNRSGNAGTLATNCIVLLFAYLSSFTSAGIVALLIKGDDSVLVTNRPLSQENHIARLYNDWGFTMKIINQRGGATSFCSSFFVKDCEGRYQLVRDVLRVVEKLGRALSASKPASYFLDYYVAVVDTAVSYQDDVLVKNLQHVTSVYYNQSIDVVTLVEFIRYISSSSRIFLNVLYGLTEKQITNLDEIDDVIEVLTRTKSDRFVKAKQLADGHRIVRLSLLDKLKMSPDWIFD